MNRKHVPLTVLFYESIGVSSMLLLFYLFYWSLSLNSSIYALINNTKSEPWYLYPYLILTLCTIALFGMNTILFVYRWRRFGFPKLRFQAGQGLGSLVGIAASACPVCGSFILSTIGIAGGLAIFPLQGLELKALSFGLLAFSFWVMWRDLRKEECGQGSCPIAHDPSLKEKEGPLLFLVLVALIVLASATWNSIKYDPIFVRTTTSITPSSDESKLYREVTAKVLPDQGFQSKVTLGNSVVKLVENGVIDKGKFLAIYSQRSGLPEGLKDVLDQPSDKAILLTKDNANVYVNLLWPLGLSNYMSTNKKSPIVGKSLFNFASTGGWDLGKEKNGGAYFNKFKIVKLLPDQEALVAKVAENTYRPCCNNSTFFQDCNHGSALLGLLELGASQGLSEDELYREALVFNSFWFPQSYIQTALYFKVVKDTDWEKVDPKVALGFDYSTGSGWSKNVQTEIAKIPKLLPPAKGGVGCGV